MFWKGAGMVGITNSLTNITDDNRINVDPAEYVRISRALDYYRNSYQQIRFLDSEGNWRSRPLNPLNMTKTVARRLASITFNEQCEISVEPKAKDQKDDQLNDFINDTLLDNDFKNKFEEKLELGVALGGFAIRPYVDGKKIKLAWIRADQFFPLQSNTNEISEAVIASKTTVSENHSNVYYTLLEFHTWDKDGKTYNIDNELYRSNIPDYVGNSVPLSSLDKYAELQPHVSLTGMTRPMFIYFKTPGANNINVESPLGVGLVDNAKEVLDDINLTHDQFMWEVKVGKRRISIDPTLLRFDDTHKATFDVSEAVYEGSAGQGGGITDLTQPIRTVQYKDALSYFIKELEIQTGLSTGTFSYSEDGIKTATEVASNNSMTYQTRSSYLTMTTKAISELCETIMEIANCGELFVDGIALYQPIDFSQYKVNVHYDDGIFVDKDKQMDEDLKNAVAKLLPRKQFLVRNYGLSDSDADEWLKELDDDTTAEMNNSFNAVGSGEPDNGDS